MGLLGSLPVNKLKSLLHWFTGLRSWDKCFVCGIGAVSALSMALLYGKVTNAINPDPDELAQRIAEDKARSFKQFGRPIHQSPPSDSWPDRELKNSLPPSVWDRVWGVLRHSSNYPIYIMLAVIMVVWAFWRGDDASPPHHESDDDVKW